MTRTIYPQKVYGLAGHRKKYDKERCAAGVWRNQGWQHGQCWRSPGYGRDKLFCQQHAEKYP